MLFQTLTNFEIQKYYENEENLLVPGLICWKSKDATYVVNLDEYEPIETHGISLYLSAENVTQFDSFGVKHIPKKTRKSIGNKNIKTNIYRK